MITKDQITSLSQVFNIDVYSIFREYLQLVFLSYLYQEKEADKIFFKGGTALRLLFNSPRFSEDLDFSTDYKDIQIKKLLKKVLDKIKKELPSLKLVPLYNGKEGIRFRVIFESSELKYPLSVRLDFHQEKISKSCDVSTLSTKFPVIIFPQVYHLSGEAILGEKIEALKSRSKGRDVFDIWFLLSKGIKFNNIDKKSLIKDLRSFPQNLLEKDLGKFLPRSQKQIIPVLKKEITRLLGY